MIIYIVNGSSLLIFTIKKMFDKKEKKDLSNNNKDLDEIKLDGNKLNNLPSHIIYKNKNNLDNPPKKQPFAFNTNNKNLKLNQLG